MLRIAFIFNMRALGLNIYTERIETSYNKDFIYETTYNKDICIDI